MADFAEIREIRRQRLAQSFLQGAQAEDQQVAQDEMSMLRNFELQGLKEDFARRRIQMQPRFLDAMSRLYNDPMQDLTSPQAKADLATMFEGLGSDGLGQFMTKYQNFRQQATLREFNYISIPTARATAQGMIQANPNLFDPKALDAVNEMLDVIEQSGTASVPTGLVQTFLNKVSSGATETSRAHGRRVSAEIARGRLAQGERRLDIAETQGERRLGIQERQAATAERRLELQVDANDIARFRAIVNANYLAGTMRQNERKLQVLEQKFRQLAEQGGFENLGEFNRYALPFFETLIGEGLSPEDMKETALGFRVTGDAMQAVRDAWDLILYEGYDTATAVNEVSRWYQPIKRTGKTDIGTQREEAIRKAPERPQRQVQPRGTSMSEIPTTTGEPVESVIIQGLLDQMMQQSGTEDFKISMPQLIDTVKAAAGGISDEEIRAMAEQLQQDALRRYEALQQAR